MSSSSSGDSSSPSSSSSSSSTPEDQARMRDKLKRLKRKIRREERKAEKILKRKLKRERKMLKRQRKHRKRPKVAKVEEYPEEVPQQQQQPPPVDEKTSNIPISLMEKSRAMAPMSKEEWEKRQSVVRKVLDEESGRYRLIKGDGEVLEEIVPMKRHKEINKQATDADGAYFQTVLHSKRAPH